MATKEVLDFLSKIVGEYIERCAEEAMTIDEFKVAFTNKFTGILPPETFTNSKLMTLLISSYALAYARIQGIKK